MTRSELLAVAAAALLAGCQRAATPTPPHPTTVEPPAGLAGAPQEVTIRGEAFRLEVVQSVDHRESRVAGTYRAWLDAVDLEAVEWVDPGTLRARVPASIAPGLHDLVVEGPFGRGVLAGGYRALADAPSILAATGSLVPALASTGQTITATLTVEHRGGAPVELSPAMDVGGTVTLVQTGAPAARRLDEGARAVFTWTYRAETAGDAALSPRVDCVDAASGAPFSAPPASAPLRLAARVERRAALEAALSLPDAIAAGAFAVTMTVANRGDAAALGVAPAPLAPAPGSTAAVSLVAAPAGPVDVAGGAVATFSWTYRTEAGGLLRLSGSASGTDANDGGPCLAAAISNDGVVAGVTVPGVSASVVAVDPLGDASTFAFVAPLGADVYLGPSRTGTGLARMSPDGGAPASVALSFPRDTTGNLSRNAHPPYTSVGFYGCVRDAAADTCGPDDEDGRGLLATAVVGGQEWLLLGGARAAGDLDYVYASQPGTSPLAFSYVDLSQLLGGATRSLTAALSSGGWLYLGFSDTGGSRPYGIALKTTPRAPGLDARVGSDAVDLRVDDAFRAATATFPPIAMVDALAEHAGRLYAFSSVGCIVSRTSTPAGPADFADCAPASSAGYDAGASVAPVRAADLLPRDRAWPQVASWNGRLYAIRNTRSGPQLWACDPAGGADPVACEGGDWALVAADAAGLARLGQPAADAATLLVATPAALYVGLDDAVSGVHVYRTTAAVPALITDFAGEDGCVAGSAGCAGIGGDGFGAPAALTRIFDAKAVTGTDGRSGVVLTAGNGVAPVQVIRIAE
ncbi:hypothetical protein [Anaeromyxobacter oryzae]|uniref:Uncharacterized protein n=1 Tax=Anaeromyxobacter oryzae TaxID=2918170 RepID=A0ABM7X179_9BACT|nr:hypothetical protein [Anaeromyxobacter oryzae]BDG05524.1 hypothetical protein AMOR_45200 [Anaeromyxobacter oryzae]